MKNVIAYVSVKHILLVDIHSDLLQLTENGHLDILSAIDLYEIQKCEVNYFNHNFTGLFLRYYDQLSRIQLIQSINKQT
jgi:hypothetical protein